MTDTIIDIINDISFFFAIVLIIQTLILLFLLAYLDDKIFKIQKILDSKKNNKYAKRAYCFNCEIYMTVVKIKKQYHCTNCGLIHNI